MANQCEYRVQRIKRAAVSRPQDRKDAGPSLANIGLRVHQLVKIPVHLGRGLQLYWGGPAEASTPEKSPSFAVLVCRHR